VAVWGAGAAMNFDKQARLRQSCGAMQDARSKEFRVNARPVCYRHVVNLPYTQNDFSSPLAVSSLRLCSRGVRPRVCRHPRDVLPSPPFHAGS